MSDNPNERQSKPGVGNPENGFLDDQEVRGRAAGAATGAVAGAVVAGPVGAVAGGLVGQAVGALMGAEAGSEAGHVEVVTSPGEEAAALSSVKEVPEGEQQKTS
jgi:outer membrane lipoprotein SlyB